MSYSDTVKQINLVQAQVSLLEASLREDFYIAPVFRHNALERYLSLQLELAALHCVGVVAS